MERRDFLTHTGVTAIAIAAATGLPVAHAQTAANAPGWNKAAFDSKTLNDAAKAMGATGAPVESKDLMLRAPEIAENGNVETNIKMGQSSNVYARAKAGDKYYFAVKEVKVTLGGCGG